MEIQTTKMMVPYYHLEMRRESDIEVPADASDLEKAATIAVSLLRNLPTEALVAIHLNAAGRILGVEKVGMGSVISVRGEPAQILRGALVQGAVGIILAHNHPSGDAKALMPSAPDLALTYRVANEARVFEIDLVDHIIVSGDKWSSIKQLVSKPTEEMQKTMAEAHSLMTGLSPEIMDAIQARLGALIAGGQTEGQFDLNVKDLLGGTDKEPKKGGGNMANEPTSLTSFLMGSK